MHHTKLIVTLRTLNPRERNRWRSWVHSDFVNKNEHLRRLCDLVLAHAPGFDNPLLEKKKVFPVLFGASRAYDELTLNNLISDLLELLHGFLAYLQYEARPRQQILDLADQLLRRDLGKSAAAALEKARRQLDQVAERNAGWLETEQRWWELHENLHARQSRHAPDDFLLRQADAADLRLVLEKLRLACIMISRNSLAVAQADFQPRQLDHLRRWCTEEPLLSEHPAVQTYLAVLDLLEQGTEQSYTQLTGMLERHQGIFPDEELAALYQYALNYCIRKINDGQPDGHRQALNLYQTLLDKALLLRDGQLSQWTYKNITTAGLRCREFEWTAVFLQRYKALLPPADRDNAFAYNLAVLHFEQEQYTDALRALQGVEFTDFTYHLGAKIMQLKIYYLLGESEALMALIDATGKLLRRNRSLSAYGKSANLNFLSMLRYLMRKQMQPQRRQAPAGNQQDIRLKMQNLQPLANKEWLMVVAGL
ncbi:MAG: hypothetical protein IT259_15105 [Saprospiraceae bacterium]|nr:hypothetical protein [Saprospiraceae bacterium]